MENLLIVGRDAKQIIALSVALSGCFPVVTVVETNNLSEAAEWHASRGHYQVLACVDERDAPDAVRGLLGGPLQPVFFAPAGASLTRRFLAQEGAIVVDASESTETLLATLHAYAHAKAETAMRSND